MTKGTSKVAPRHDEVLQLFADGLTYEEIGRHIGVSGKRVKAYFVNNGLPLRSRSEAMKLMRQKQPSHFQQRDMRGPNNPTWKGGHTVSASGYPMVLLPGHPRADKKGYVFEHILVWENVHKKPLPPGWIVHHLNGVKADNRPVNLAGMPNKKHANILSSKSLRVRALEVENQLLRNALEKSQSLFVIGEN